MFKKLLSSIKEFFTSDPEDMDADELVALVANRETPEDRRRAGVEALSEVSDVIGNIEDDAEKGAVSNRCYKILTEVLSRSGEPDWIIQGAIKGMNEIANVGRYDMDPALIEASVDPLIAHLGRQYSAGIRSAACSALASIDEKVSDYAARRSVGTIMDVVRAESGELRGDAIFSLGSFDSERTAALWREVATYLEDPSAEVRRHTASALWMIGNEEPDNDVIERLIAMLGSEPDDEVRSNVVDALGHLGKGHPGVVVALSKALDNEGTRHMAIFALLEFGEEAEPAVGKLAVLLDDDEHADSAVMALQGIGTPSARAALRAKGHPEES